MFQSVGVRVSQRRFLRRVRGLVQTVRVTGFVPVKTSDFSAVWNAGFHLFTVNWTRRGNQIQSLLSSRRDALNNPSVASNWELLDETLSVYTFLLDKL